MSIAAQLEAFAATSADYSGSTGGGGSRSGRVNFAEDERGERDGREHERGGRLGERERERDERSYHSASKASSVRSMETSSYHSASGSVRSAHSVCPPYYTSTFPIKMIKMKSIFKFYLNFVSSS